MYPYKNKDLEVNIQTGTIKRGNHGILFYSEDKGTASIRIKITDNNRNIDFTKIDLVPYLDLFMEDGSIFKDEEFRMIAPQYGQVQYDIPKNIIRHVGQVHAKIILKNSNKSIHVADFYFTIGDSGIEGAVAKEISVNIVDDAVKKIMNEQPELFKGEKGDKGDTGPQGIQGPQGPQGEKGEVGESAYELAIENGFKGSETEWLASLKGKDGASVPANGSITTEKLAPKSVQKNNLSDDINMNSILSGKLVGPPLVIDFKKGEITVPSGIRIVNGGGNYGVKPKTLLLSSATGNVVYILFNYSSGELILKDYTPSINFRTYAVVGVILKDRESITVSGEYNIVGREGRQAFLPFNASLSSTDKNVVIDFTKKTMTTVGGTRPYLLFKDSVIAFGAGEYSFADSSAVFFIGYDTATKSFVFINHNLVSSINFNTTAIFGMINKKTEEFSIEGVGYEVIKTNVGGSTGSEPSAPSETSKPFYFLGDPGGSYIPKIEDYYYKQSYHKNYENFMAEWEELRTNNPGYVTRKQIGTSVQGRAMYAYHFNYYDVMNPIDERPIIYVNNGIHAIETHGIYAILAFFKDLCDNWLNDDQLGFIHNNIHLVVVPLANPDGFVANTRQNANGVDINRNFSRGWNNKNNEVKGDLTYPGTGALSEPEAQALESLLEEIKPLYTFDIHNNGSLESKKDLISISTGTDRLRYFVKAFGNSFDYRMRKKFPEIKDWNAGGKHNLVMDRLANPGGSLAYSAVQLGSNGSTVEFTTGWDPYPPETHQYINKDAMGNLILGVMRSTDRL